MDQEDSLPAWIGRRRLSEERLPLWRGRDKRRPEVLRRRYELYVEEFERYVEQRPAT